MNDQGKTIAIISHITIIGWVIAVAMNSNHKSEFASFYIRQMLGLFAIGVVGGLIPIFNLFVALIVIAGLIYSLVGAVTGIRNELPIVGSFFQDWFKSL